MFNARIRLFAGAWVLSMHAQAEADGADTLTLPPRVATYDSSFRAQDSVSLPEGDGLQQRLGRFPGMRIDQQGRLKWRGTEEFRIYVSGVPVDADLMPALPAGFEAEVTGDPQPDARFSSAGMTGILNIDPTPSGKSSYLKLRSGGGWPALGWGGGSGLWNRPSSRIWGQLQSQGSDEPTRELWRGADGASIKRGWRNAEVRDLGLAGVSQDLGSSQTAEAEVWGNRSAYERPFSQVSFQQGAIDARWHPEGEARTAAGKGSWNWRSPRLLLQAEAAGLSGGQSVDLGEARLDDRRDWTRGRGSALWRISPELSAEAGGEHAWEGRSMTGLGAEGALWEEKQEAVWLQAQSRWRRLRVTAGLRWEDVDRGMTDGSYSHSEWRVLPSGALYGELPGYGIVAYARYSRRIESPQPTFVVPGGHRISGFEWHQGNAGLQAETIQGSEFGFALPVPGWKAKLEAKAFSATADHMLIRRFAWVGDSTVLSIRNGEGEARLGGEGSWEQEIPGGLCGIYLGGWSEDRETEGPKEDLLGFSGRLHVRELIGRRLMLGLDLGWTGPTFEAEGKAESYWEEGLRLDWTPASHWVLHLGGDEFWGADRTLEIQGADGSAWSRTRYSNGPRAWANLEWEL
jgi:hypothetical protein